MSYVICSQCQSETDAKLSQCQYCGKILIIESKKPVRSDSDELGDYFSEDIEVDDFLNPDAAPRTAMSHKGQNTRSIEELSDDDLFADLDSLERDLDEDITGKISEKVKTTKSADLPTFENPFKKSKLFKKLQEDQDLFGDLED